MRPLLALLFLQAPAPACDAASLRCFDLVPVPALRTASGVVALTRPPTPFTVAVTRDGHHVYDVVLTLTALPDPATLGPYGAYVAWATTPTLDPVFKLGPVGNGRMPAVRVALNRFVILVTAERSADVTERTGRLVLRGVSPSTYALPLDATDLPAARGHDHARDTTAWVVPPTPPYVAPMPAGLHALRPPVTPFLPGAGRDVAALPAVRPRTIVTLSDGDSLDLEATLVRRVVAGRPLVMYAFNGQHPGPLIRVPQGAAIVVRFTNRLDLPSTVHWHGVRLDSRFDGVPHVTQEPVPPGGSFRYVVRFPDAGVYWYHPHVREDIQQDLGLYGNLFVAPRPGGLGGSAHREEFLILDDLLLGETGPVPHGREHATHALMGRFGNVLLVNGEPRYRLTVRPGEIVRLYLTNASNTRTFNLSLGGARLKLVGADLGPFEREEWVESVVLAPAERYIVDARFDAPGPVALTNRVQALDRVAGTFVPVVDTLGTVSVAGPPIAPGRSAAFDSLRAHSELTAELAPHRARAVRGGRPERTLRVTLRADGLPFGLIQALRLDTAYVHPVEWAATMPMMDWLSTARDVTWVLRDESSGMENMAIAWRFRRGETALIRVTNDRRALHPMAHPLHAHGQRFLVLAVDGEPVPNMAWKDTFLLPAGSTADILLELSNPGRWMLHCHIAEHLAAGMHLVFEVAP